MTYSSTQQLLRLRKDCLELPTENEVVRWAQWGESQDRYPVTGTGWGVIILSSQACGDRNAPLSWEALGQLGWACVWKRMADRILLRTRGAFTLICNRLDGDLFSRS